MSHLPIEVILLLVNIFASGGIYLKLGAYGAMIKHLDYRLTKLEGLLNVKFA